MKKLLFVLLVPVLVLGVMGCGKNYVNDTETDAWMQGSWTGNEAAVGGLPAATSAMSLAISAGQLTVKYGDFYVMPYRTEFNYYTDDRVLSTAADISALLTTLDLGNSGATPLVTVNTGTVATTLMAVGNREKGVMVGELTLFRYSDNVELFRYNVAAANGAGVGSNLFVILNREDIEEPWYLHTEIPVLGWYADK